MAVGTHKILHPQELKDYLSRCGSAIRVKVHRNGYVNIKTVEMLLFLDIIEHMC